MVLLDATAGNRHLWGEKWDQDISYVVFLDIEPRLKIPPSIIADFRDLPFREGVFQSVIFDPPWIPRILSRHDDPTEKKGTYWGNPGHNKLALIKLLVRGLREIARVTDRLCCKFGDFEISKWNFMGLLKSLEWDIKAIKEYKSKAGRGNRTTFWFTCVVKRPRKRISDTEQSPLKS